MKECTTQLMLFKGLLGKKIEVDFDGGEVSSDAGLLFLRETEAKHGIIRRMANVLRDRRHKSYITHDLLELFSQRVFQIASGYEDANDSNDLRKDPIIKIACEKPPDSTEELGSQPTMCRFENAPSRTDLYRLGEAFVDLFIDSYKRAPKGIILDLDDTEDETHGHQQLSLFNAFHDMYCYMPMHIYEGKSGKLVAAILRPGKRPSGKEIVSILKRIVKKIRLVWPDVGIMIRGDAHYGAPEVYDFCEENDLKFVFGLTPRNPMWEETEELVDEARELYTLHKEPIKLFGEFEYQAKSWSKPLRVIYKAEHNHRGPNTRFVVTNLEDSRRRFIYQNVYSGRGKMELYIKEHKNHLFSDRTSCTSFEANQFRLFLHSMAYVLMHTFRQLYLKGTQYARAQFDTIRLRVIKIGARVRQLSTKVKIHLPSSFPLKEELWKIWRSCCLKE
ncbi:MAG: IS1380 family transposase [Candidatus Aminicenantes bacterium]|nr:IS1380 family transposase [Candidatus Aminicenantes bacterium]